MKYLKLTLIAFTSQCIAQSTPSEFAEMSLQDLLEQSVYEIDLDQASSSPWTLSYQYKTVEFGGYLDGTKELTFDDVLWNGPGETRTAKNFPVVPTYITQEAHIVSLWYQFNSRWQGHISIPHIKQTTDHISIVSNYNHFVLTSEGVGDTSIAASYNWSNSDAGVWRLSFGVNLPTGSIDQEGDTPREPGDQQLPYTMQLGSGTYDFPLELSFQQTAENGFSGGLSANIRTGTNDRNYRLGNNYSVNGRYSMTLSPTFRTFAGLAFKYSDSIHGQDESILLNGPFRYPAGITNPDLFGGKRINAKIGLLWQISKDYRLNVELGAPVYQNLRGPQPKEKWRSALYISKAL